MPKPLAADDQHRKLDKILDTHNALLSEIEQLRVAAHRGYYKSVQRRVPKINRLAATLVKLYGE
jgi:hypothetical protein